MEVYTPSVSVLPITNFSTLIEEWMLQDKNSINKYIKVLYICPFFF